MRSIHQFTVVLLLLCLLYSCQPTTQAADAEIKAQPPTPLLQNQIIGPNESTPGDLCVFHAEVPEGASLAWRIDPPEAAARFAVDTGSRAAYFASALKGRYVIFLAAAIDGEAVALTHVLTQGEPGPDPDPKPDPDPDPGPDPEPGRRFVMVIAETENRTAARASLLMGLRVWLSDRHDFRFVDPDAKDAKGDTPVWLQSYIDRLAAAKISVPALIVAAYAENSDTEVTHIFCAPLPKTVDEAIAIIKKHGG